MIMFQLVLSCTSDMSVSIESIERYIRESEESQGSTVTVLTQSAQG